MYKIIVKLVVLMFVIIACSNKQDDEISTQIETPNHPFPNHTTYTNNHIKPNNYSQTELDNQTQTFYDQWKLIYLKNDCNNDEYYVFSGNGAKTVSEAIGYGMMITAFMTGYDTQAKLYFDNLFKYYKSHPSIINNHLMDWQQVTCNDSPSFDDDSATDGDLDVAFSLLLAHKQWGSTGNINYLDQAKTILTAIMQDEINQEIFTVKLGDFSNLSNLEYYYATRTSDFITSHFKAFSTVTNNTNWNLVVDKCYNLIDNMQTNQSQTTGLMPDFIINTNLNPIPANAYFLEDVYDGDYSYNACRFPWRIGIDYLTNNEVRAKTALTKINDWLLTTTSGDATAVSNGYLLDGTPIFDWNDATFIGPFTVGAMASTNQTWLNSLYQELITNNDLEDGDYYSNTIKLLSLITISGNYWNPSF